MSAGPDASRSAEPSSVAAQYETLRKAALGEPLPPDARAGLVLFLRRGMWGWVRALAAVPRAPLPPPPAAASATPNHLTGVIQVLAAMALASPHRSAR